METAELRRRAGRPVRGGLSSAQATGALVFAGLAALTWILGHPDPHPAWLATAAAHADAVRSLGVGLLSDLAPTSDPRTLPAAAALALGCSATLTLLLARLLTLAAAAASVVMLARPGAKTDWTGALLLAVAPLWIEGSLGADPHVGLGLVLLLVARAAGPQWLRVAGVGWALGWSPWAWAALPVLLAGTLREPQRRWRGPALLALGIAALWLLHPPALLHPGEWLRAMIESARAAWSPDSGFGLRSSWLPLTGSLHWAGLALVLLAALGWPRRVRAGDFGPVAVLAVTALMAGARFHATAPILLLLPWVAGEAGTGWRTAARRLRRSPGPIAAAALLALLLAPATAVLIGRWQAAPRAETGPGDLARALARLGPGSLVVHDSGIAVPDSSELTWLELPFHAAEPGRYAGAHWEGWFPAAAAVIVSEERVVRYLRAPEQAPAAIAFYQALTMGQPEETVLGSSPGRRLRVLWREPSDRVLGDGWQTRLRAGRGGDLPAAFVAALGGALTRSGHPGEAAALLEEALAAGFEEIGIHLNLSNAYLELGRVMDAGRVLDAARRSHPESPELLFNLGLVLTRAGLWNRAVRTLARLQQEWPRSAQVCYLLGVALMNENQPSAARAQLERALELDPRLPQRTAVEKLLEQLDSRR